MDSPIFDIIVKDRKGSPLAVVEIKTKKEQEFARYGKKTSQSALSLVGKLHGALIEEAMRLKAKYIVFVTIDKGNRPRAWFNKIRNGNELSEVPHFSDIIRRYNEAEIPTEAINHLYLQTLVWSWFLDIAKGRERDEKVTDFLKEIGFYNKAINGDAELELAA